MLGLRRGSVSLVAHDPRWIGRGREVKASLINNTGLPDEHVQHAGSTVVPGISAKPIIKLVFVVEDPFRID